MKANQPKRKLFNDAVDLLTGDAPGRSDDEQEWFEFKSDTSALVRPKPI